MPSKDTKDSHFKDCSFTTLSIARKPAPGSLQLVVKTKYSSAAGCASGFISCQVHCARKHKHAGMTYIM